MAVEPEVVKQKEDEYVKSGKIDIRQLEALDSETDIIMKSEFSASFKLAIAYFAFIFAIPVLNWYAKDFMLTTIWGGMTISWFLTAIVGLALAIVIAAIHMYLYEKRMKSYQKITSASSNQLSGRSTVR